MWLTPWQGIGLVALAAALITIAMLSASAPASCSNAEASLEHGLVKQALIAYEKILKDEPDSECAHAGMMAVVQRLCDRANALAEAGHQDDADKAASAVFALEPPFDAVVHCDTHQPDANGGDVGLRGPRGFRGAQGEQGVRGALGVQGPRGVQGQAGARGPKGERGPPGRTGASGQNGRNGRNGRNGSNGRDAYRPFPG